MIFKKLEIPEVILIEPKIHCDTRGFFFESYNENDFNSIVERKISFVQDNHSRSRKGFLRRLHFQKEPFQQGKLVRVLNGEIWDVAVDIRNNSETFGHWVGLKLSASNRKQLWIPEGFAHGFYVISDFADVLYKVNKFYSKEHEQTIHWKNNEFNINWPIIDGFVQTSEKDGFLNLNKL